MSNIDSEQLFFDVQQKTDKQHILDNPDTYIGSVEQIDSDMWIMSDDEMRYLLHILMFLLIPMELLPWSMTATESM